MDRLLTITMGLSAALIVLVLTSVRRAHIRVEYSVSWLAASVILLALASESDRLEWLAQLLGIDYPPMALLFIATGVFLVVFYRFSIIISDLKDSNIALVQKIAILEYKIQSLHEESESFPRS